MFQPPNPDVIQTLYAAETYQMSTVCPYYKPPFGFGHHYADITVGTNTIRVPVYIYPDQDVAKRLGQPFAIYISYLLKKGEACPILEKWIR